MLSETLRRLCMQLTTLLGHTSGIALKAKLTSARHSCRSTKRGAEGEEKRAMDLNSSTRRGSYWLAGSSDLGGRSGRGGGERGGVGGRGEGGEG